MKTLPIDLAGLNHFLRVAIGGMDWLLVPTQEQRDYIYPIIRELDPNEIFWHIDDEYIWRTDPWKESQNKIRELHERRLKDQIELDKRKQVKDQLVIAIAAKFSCAKDQAEIMALEFIRKGAKDCIEFFGVDISILEEIETNKPHVVLEEGKKIDEY